MDFDKYIRNIPNFPKPGILFKDITPLLADPHAFHTAIQQFVVHYEHHPIDAISAAEARGFLFAAPLAYLMKKPLVPLRKPGKLPYQTHKLQYDLSMARPSCKSTSTALIKGPRCCSSMTYWRQAALSKPPEVDRTGGGQGHRLCGARRTEFPQWPREIAASRCV